MIEQEIVDYIIKAQKHGLSDIEIKQNLLNVGWEAAMVEESFVFSRAAENKANFADTGSPKQFHQATPSTLAHTQVPATVQSQPVKTLPTNFPSPTAGLSDQHFQTTTVKSSSFFKKPLFWVVFLLLILSGGGAFGYYKYIYATPTTVWNKFLLAKENPVYKSSYTISYSDPTVKNGDTNKPITVSFKGQTNFDLSDANNSKIKADTALGFDNGTVGVNLNLNYLVIGNVLYFDIGQIEQLKGLLPDPNIEWLKLDFDELQKYAQENSKSASTTNEFTPELKARLKEIWSKASIIKPTDYFEKETVSNSPTYHLKLNLDNNSLKSAIIDSIVAIQAAETDDQPKMDDSQKQALGAFLSKITAKEFEVWIGQKDNQLYKFHLILNVPTVSDVKDSSLTDSVPALATAKAKDRDALRFSEIKQFQEALDLYNTDHGGYPPANNSGQPQNLTPQYLGEWLTAPSPADGNCSNYYNSYWYTPEGKAKTTKWGTLYPSYSITFCVGNDTSGYSAGIAKLTPGGIVANITCPSTVENCVNTTRVAPINMADAINNMSFKAEFKFDFENSDFGNSINITTPNNPTNLMDLIKNQTKIEKN